MHAPPEPAVAAHPRELGPPRKRHDRAPELGRGELNRRVDLILAVEPEPNLLHVRLEKMGRRQDGPKDWATEAVIVETIFVAIRG